MENPQDLITKRIQELPQYVRDAIAEAQATTKLRDITARHHLRVDQQAVVEREVMLVMLGFTDEASFVKNLVSQAKVTEESAQNLAQDIGGEIFSHIRQAMRRLETETGQNAPVPKTAQAPAPVPPQAPAATPKQAEPVLAIRTASGDAHAALAPIDSALSGPRLSPPQKVDVGLAPAKPGYKTDPYLEPIE
jgi:hypothetical protein